MIFPIFTSLAGVPPDNLGVRQHELSACPSSPNCISTEAPDEAHSIPPLIINRSAKLDEVMPKVVEVINELPRTTIKKNTKNYLHVEIVGLIGWVDDVELYIDEKVHVLQFRSAARSGYYDFGSNKKHYEIIKKRLLEKFSDTFTLY